MELAILTIMDKYWKITCVYAHSCITIQHQYCVFHV